MQGARRIITQPGKWPCYDPRDIATMNLKRTATIVVVGGALLAWLAGAATSNRAIEPAPADRACPRSTRAASRSRRKSRGSTNVCGRPPRRINRVAISSRSARRASARCRRRSAPPAPALVEAPPLPPPLPPLKLVGIAEDPGADGPVRTAIIAGERAALHGQGRRERHRALSRRRRFPPMSSSCSISPTTRCDGSRFAEVRSLKSEADAHVQLPASTPCP